MQFLTVTYLLSLLVLPSLTVDECYSCASTMLEENWEVTNLPKKPDGLTFTDDCKSDTDPDLVKPCSQGVCYEAIIPLNNRATYVRGCYQDFVEETNLTRGTVSTPQCLYGQVNKATFLDIDSKTPPKPAQAYAASRWCVNTADDVCNKELKYNGDLFINPGRYFTKCTNPGSQPVKKCIECSHAAGVGECSAGTATTCQGGFCVKYEGYLNGDPVIVRTCSPTTPFSGDYCAQMDSSSDFQLFGITLKMPYKAQHCFCTGDMCNPSSPVSSSLLFSIVLPLILTRCLPFFSS